MTAEISAVSAEDRAAIVDLVERATAADGVAAISESSLLALRHDAQSSLVAKVGDKVVGYAAVTDGERLSIEILIDPEHRRSGIASALLSRLGVIGESPAAADIWAHGNLESAQGFSAQVGLAKTRVLWQMRRPLDGQIDEPAVPAGILIRPFVVGADEDAWVLVNARAFAHHPEQGAWTLRDLLDRQGESWFDPAGFLVAEVVSPLPEHPDLAVGRMAGSHWTKVHPSAPGTDGPIGEVYVVGVDPDAQGLGLGKALTLAGLQHLRSLGLSDVLLYVDDDNTAAMALYRRLGFTPYAVDVQYSAAAK